MDHARLASRLLFLSLASVSVAPAAPERWEKDIAAFESADAMHPPAKGGSLFIGSSSIRMWTSLEEDFPGHNVINRGFGGSQLEDSIAFIDRIVIPYEPRKIFIYAGANDINAGKSPDCVLADFKTFVSEARAKLPHVVVAFISIAGNPARWAQVERVRRANELVADYARGDPQIEFIDVFSHMMGPDGLPKPDIFIKDRLHMNEKGYAIWREVVDRHLPPQREQPRSRSREETTTSRPAAGDRKRVHALSDSAAY